MNIYFDANLLQAQEKEVQAGKCPQRVPAQGYM
jgi:hypothetical protein